MRRTLLATFAATALLAACSTAPDNAGNASASADGAPNQPAANAATVELQRDVGDRVFFATDDSAISAEGQKTLARQAEWLKNHSALTVTIEGHCDERGTREYNLALGARRADMVQRVLVALGVDRSRITTTTYGKERPAVVGSDETAWAQNRRAVTVVN